MARVRSIHSVTSVGTVTQKLTGGDVEDATSSGTFVFGTDLEESAFYVAKVRVVNDDSSQDYRITALQGVDPAPTDQDIGMVDVAHGATGEIAFGAGVHRVGQSKLSINVDPTPAASDTDLTIYVDYIPLSFIRPAT